MPAALREGERPGFGLAPGTPTTFVGVFTYPKAKAVAMAVIDLSFVLVGTTIPLDHGYALFTALCRIVPELHGDRRVGVHPIRGRQSAPGVLSLTERSRLKVRLPAEGIAPYIAIAGKELDLEGRRVRVGIPQVEGLVTAADLAARLVTFKHAMDTGEFEVDVRRELARMEIAATPQLILGNNPSHPAQPVRRVIRIKGRRIVAYPLCVVGMTAEESIRLQENGLGGRRRMGCGVFAPFGKTVNRPNPRPQSGSHPADPRGDQ